MHMTRTQEAAIKLESKLRDVFNTGPGWDLVKEAADMLNDLRKENEYWHSVAIYLADCHAATAEYDGGLKGVSKSRKKRLASICHTAAQAISGHYYAKYRTSEPSHVIERCEKAVKSLEGSDR
jgi:hypothetical protein